MVPLRDKAASKSRGQLPFLRRWDLDLRTWSPIFLHRSAHTKKRKSDVECNPCKLARNVPVLAIPTPKESLCTEAFEDRSDAEQCVSLFLRLF